MDITCPTCTEPLDIAELHEIDGMTFDQARDSFFTKGCGSLGFGGCHKVDSLRGDASAALFDIMGDDIDGIASMMDDAEYLGLFD